MGNCLLKDEIVRAVDGASLSIQKNETFALIGETGSGKSVLGLAVLRLLPKNVCVEGDIFFNGVNLLDIPEKKMRRIRGKHIAWIPQNPATAMNPSIRVGNQIAEPIQLHFGLKKSAALEKASSLLEYFDIKPSNVRSKEYPFQYSGGMLQRALVAMGTSTSPELIIADEPTKGVDVIKKRNIGELFEKIKQSDCSILLITHDLEFAKKVADRVAVNYCGQILEICNTRQFFDSPLHPYSKALLASLPSRGLKPIKGDSPSMTEPPRGCRFHPRCVHAKKQCLIEPPVKKKNGNTVRCWLYD